MDAELRALLHARAQLLVVRNQRVQFCFEGVHSLPVRIEGGEVGGGAHAR